MDFGIAHESSTGAPVTLLASNTASAAAGRHMQLLPHRMLPCTTPDVVTQLLSCPAACFGYRPTCRGTGALAGHVQALEVAACRQCCHILCCGCRPELQVEPSQLLGCPWCCRHCCNAGRICCLPHGDADAAEARPRHCAQQCCGKGGVRHAKLQGQRAADAAGPADNRQVESSSALSGHYQRCPDIRGQQSGKYPATASHQQPAQVTLVRGVCALGSCALLVVAPEAAADDCWHQIQPADDCWTAHFNPSNAILC